MVRGRTTRVDHPLALEVLHVGEAAGHLVRDVEPRDRLADDGVIPRVLRHRLGVDLQLQVAATHELRVGNAGAAAARRDHAVGDCERLLRDTEPCRRLRKQCLARGGCRLPDLHAANLDRQAAERDALIRRQQRVALDHVDARERHRELLGSDLRHRGANAGAEVDLARVHGHLAARVDGDEAIDLVERDGLRGPGCIGRT
jgi:hypothetical protein